MSFYRLNGKYFARMKTCHSKERIRNDPAFAKTYQCGLDFGTASRASKLMRGPLQSVLPHVGDKGVVSRLTGRLVKVLQRDGVHDAGKRELGDGDLSLLKGFEFNKRTAFHQVFASSHKIVVSQADQEVTLFVPRGSLQGGIVPPPGATHTRLFTSAVCINAKNNSQSASARYSGYLDLRGGKLPSLEMVNAIVGKPGDVMVVVLGIEFFQEVNGQMEVLMHGGAMVIAEAGKVERQSAVHGRRSTVDAAKAYASRRPERVKHPVVHDVGGGTFHGERQVCVISANLRNHERVTFINNSVKVVEWLSGDSS